LIKTLRRRRRSPAVERIVGAAALILFSYISVLLGFDFDDGRFWLLAAVVIISFLGDYLTSIALSLVAAGCLTFFFTPPIFSFRVEQEQDLVALVAFVVTSIVITSVAAKIRRMSEDELLQTRAELARYGRIAILGELTASIAHELNQPLAGLVSSGDACRRWLSKQPPNIDRAAQSLDRIVRDADRARKVVDRVRGLAKNTPPRKVSVNLREAIREVILITRDEAERSQIKLESEFVEDLAFVWADRIQFQQVCLNLIVNAMDALKNVEGISRKLIIRAENGVSDCALVTVADNGAGLDSNKLDDIFNPFYTTKQDGMGMGLAISRSIVESHGGQLWASANVPRGTKFQFTMPLSHD
jgi:C4-dicarboxylate-specific signal transduction histidine kinase